MKIFHIAQTTNSVELNGTTLTVYHRTKGQDIAGNICTIGFIAGTGAAYGAGIYTNYDLKSSLKNSNLQDYGGEVVKATVNINGFLIFDYNIAKMVYGSNYLITDQIRNVIGEDKILNRSLDKGKQWREIENISNYAHDAKWTSDLASNLSHRFRLSNTGLNGLIFTGRRDGHVCVSFKELLVTPIAHAWIDGKTYKNPNWTECGQRSIDELKRIQADDQKSAIFVKARSRLLSDLRNLSDNGQININPSNYPGIPKGIFIEALANFLYEDENRIQRLSPQLRSELKDIIDVEFLIRKLKSAPTVHWEEWQKVDQKIKAQIPEELLIEIWTNFINKNPGYWDQIPDEIRELIPRDGEAKYWATLVKKNAANWKYIPDEIIECMNDKMGVFPPQNLGDIKREDEDERISETEEIDVPVSAIGWVQDNIAKMNKRAGKLGLRPITHEVVSEDPKNRTQRIKIVGNVPFLKGWKLIARLSRAADESGEEYNIVETLSDEGLPEGRDFESAELECQHCGHKRKRTECYLVKNESSEDKRYQRGETVMIGSTCLGNFIGDTGGTSTPEAIAKYAQQFKQMLNLFKEGSEYQNKTDDDIRKDFKNKGVPIAFFLTKVLQLEKQYGFVGFKDAMNTGKEATAGLAWEMCINLRVDQKYSKGVDASDLATIYSALAWISTIPEPENTNDKRSNFLWNVKQNCEMGTVFSKKRKGNIGIVSWLPTIYKKGVSEKIDYSVIAGEKNDEIWFSGVITSKRPVLVQISQQVHQGHNITQNYVIVEGEDKTVAFLDDAIIQSGINDTIYIKGKVESNVFVGGKSATVLKDVKEISEEEYTQYRPYMEQKTKELELKGEEVVPEEPPLTGSPKGNYQNGQSIVEDYKITGVRPAKGGQSLYFLQDRYGKRVSAFTGLNLGVQDDIIRVSATVQLNGQYINLQNIQLVTDKTIQSPSAAPKTVDYQDGQTVEGDFTITGSRPADYSSTLYTLMDSNGRQLSTFTKVMIGNIGDSVRLWGIIKLVQKYGKTYTNITRIKVIPKQTQSPVQPTNPTNPKMQVTKPTQQLPVQPIGTQDNNVVAKTTNWYRLSQYSS